MQRRWLQYRLRTLLVLTVLLCLALGFWHLYWTRFGPFIQVAPATVGQRLIVQGRFFDFRGPESTVYVIKVSKLMADGSSLIYQSGSGRANRKGLWTYDLETQLGRIQQPGEYYVDLLPITNAVIAAGRTKSPVDFARVRPAIRCKFRVLANDKPSQLSH